MKHGMLGHSGQVLLSYQFVVPLIIIVKKMTKKIEIKACFVGIVAVYIILSVIFTFHIYAGELEDFEAEATKIEDTQNKEVSSSNKSEHDGREKISFDDSECDSFLDCFMGMTVEILYFGGKYSFYQRRYNENLIGAPILPSFSLDTDYQNVESDIFSINNRIEVGYGPFAFQFKEMRYFERDPNDELKIYQLNYLHRMSDGEYFRIDLGIGTVTIEGNKRNTGLSLITPVYVYLPKKCSLFLRPNWGWINGNAIQDYKLGFLLSRKYISAQVGYRFVKSGEETLNGPFVGFNMHY